MDYILDWRLLRENYWIPLKEVDLSILIKINDLKKKFDFLLFTNEETMLVESRLKLLQIQGSAWGGRDAVHGMCEL
jgi:hypothetical protein